MRASGPAYLTAAAVHVLVVVAAEGLAVDEGERGDDEDDAGRCRSDGRGQPSTAFVAAERGGGTASCTPGIPPVCHKIFASPPPAPALFACDLSRRCKSV